MWWVVVALLVIGGVANALETKTKRPMVVWTAAEVFTFVRGLGLAYEPHADKLLAAGIDGVGLRGMSDAILEQSGVSEPLHRLRILSSISSQP
jgi:hypothetical protein